MSRRFLHMVWALAVLTAATACARANEIEQREDQFKAAYVFNFVKFVAWPDDETSGPLLICFVGGERVYNALTAGIDKKRVGVRRLAALQIASASPTDTCNALYIDASMARDFAPAEESAVLTISDSKGFAANGGMIELFTENHRLRFLINIQSAQQAGLRISSDLLKLAAGVQREPQ
jgi:hypothetical protein